MKRVALAGLLASSILVAAAGPAFANISKGDPNDFKYRPDIKRSVVVKYRGVYQGVETELIRATVTFYDKIPWKKVRLMQVAFDTKGTKKLDYSIQWVIGDFVEGGFGCWLMKGVGILASDIVLDETEVAAQGRTGTSATCTIPKLAMKVTKPIHWNVLIWAGPDDAPLVDTFDLAPNTGVYPHI